MEKNVYQRLADRLSQDMPFANRLLNMDPAEATAVLNQEGYQVTEDGLDDFICAAKKAIEEQKCELTEEDLLQVAGGKRAKKSSKIDPEAFGAGMVFGAIAVGLGYASIVGIAIGCAW